MGTTVFRVEKNREFVVMNHKFLREKEMSLKSKGLLALCLSLPDDWNYSLNGLCAICKESQTSIRSALKELETFGYLKRERKKDNKGQFIYEYILYEVPYNGFVHTDKQHTEKQHIEKVHTENVRQQSTKKQSTNNKDIDKENKEKDIEEILQTSVNNDELSELYRDYIDMRKNMNVPLTARALKMLITRCERLSKNNIKVQKILLENAIVNGWKNVYLPNEAELALINQETVEDLKSLFGLD
jgi:predicted transcriptional regulator